VTNTFEQLGYVTPDMLDDVRRRIGEPLRIEQYNYEATYDTIRHYALGIGDDNPLWCDEEYAAGGPYGVVVGSPTFFYSIFQGGMSFGFSGLQPFHGRSAWSWHRLPRRGERIVATSQLVDVRETKGRTADRIFIQTGQTEYRTTDGELLAVLIADVLRIPRVGAPGSLRYSPVEPRGYTAEELAEIESEVLAEERRGARPRYWEDTQPGDALTPVVKGPLDQIDMTCYYAGVLGTAGYKSCELRWQQRRNARNRPELLPDNYDTSYFAEFVLPSLGHQNATIAHAVGMPGPYDNGPMRIGWMAHLVTNWMGDAGFLAELDVRILRPNLFGNVTWCRGEVASKDLVDGVATVTLNLWATDQNGERNTSGTAQIVLPRRP
jgi:acyl dehydratase